jgi:glycerol-3-phosphate acyltransferase PlsY
MGSMPTGYLAGRLKGIDVRKEGSGNIGATNAFRVLGKGAGIAVLAIDGFKGFAAARWLPLATLHFFPHTNAEGLMLAAGVGAVLGHNYTCWLHFKGGKGIATSAGVVMAWAPLACLLILVFWGLVAALTRYVSVASIASALMLPLAVWLTQRSIPMTCVMGVLSALAIYKHKGNLGRLLAGTENRLGAKRANGQDQPRT